MKQILHSNGMNFIINPINEGGTYAYFTAYVPPFSAVLTFSCFL